VAVKARLPAVWLRLIILVGYSNILLINFKEPIRQAGLPIPPSGQFPIDIGVAKVLIFDQYESIRE